MYWKEGKKGGREGGEKKREERRKGRKGVSNSLAFACIAHIRCQEYNITCCYSLL